VVRIILHKFLQVPHGLRLQRKLDYKKHCYPVYTDGSKTNDAVAFAAHTDDFSVSYRLNKKAKIHTSELEVILEAISESFPRSNRNIAVFTDYRSSIHAITKVFTNNHIVQKKII